MIRFLLKGLSRDPSRSLFPFLMVAAGVFLTVLLYSWMQGVIGDMVSVNARYDTGHVKIMTRAYSAIADQAPNDLALLHVGRLLSELRSQEGKMIWTSRIRFGGILDVPDERRETRAQGPVMGLGVDLLSGSSPEIAILNLPKAVVEGRLPRNKGEALLTREMAHRLKVRIGDVVTLISATMYGSMATYNFKISGLTRFGVTTMDRGLLIADIGDVRQALDMSDGAGEILGFSKEMVYDDEAMQKLAERFNRMYSRPKDRFSPFMLRLSEQNGLADLLFRSQTIGGIIVGLFVFVMSLVLWQSGLINHIRRYGEIGLRLALGEPKGVLYRRMLAESLAVGFFGTLAGTLLGLGVSFYLQKHGIDYSALMQKSTLLFPDEIRARVTPVSVFIGFFPGLLAPLFGAAAAGIGIYRRQTSQLFKELEA